MLTSTAATVSALILIGILVLWLCLFVVAKHVRFRKQNCCRRKPAPLLPMTNVQSSMLEESKRRSIFGGVSPASSTTSFCVPEIRLTFPEEDVLPPTPGVPGQRVSRVVILQLGESGAAYVTSPPPYEATEGHLEKREVLREKA
jgi:hypothetical protein